MSKQMQDISQGKAKVEQVDASLDKPLNIDAPPTIYGTRISPELSTAALNLSTDFVKQQESLSNKYMVTHPVTMSILVLASAIYLSPRIIIPRNVKSGSIFGFLYQFLHFNIYTIGTLIGLGALVAMCLFTIYSRISETFFKSKIQEIVQDRGETVFGFDLSKLAQKDKKAISLKQIDNVYLIIYRETPIALVSMKENGSLSSKESLVMSITTIGCRRVYLESGILEDLLDWAMLRTKTISKNDNYGESMKLLVSVYSFDNHMKKTLKSKGFTLIQSARIKESRLLGGLFGAKKELWGVQFHFQPNK